MTWFVFYVCYVSVGWIIRLAMVLIVLRRQLAPGASLAWLGIVFLHPYIGLSLYMLVGESRLGPRRTARHQEIVAQFRDPARNKQREIHQTVPDSRPSYQPMVLQAEKISGLPVLAGNGAEFFSGTDRFIDALVADIAGAKSHVHLLYYIFAGDRTAQRVADAVIAAAGRGVRCRVLADGLASRAFFHRDGLAPKFRAAGVEVAAALPVTPLRRRLARMDLRNHRKLAVIDDSLAWVGSHNIINADYGGKRGNPWVDVTGRFTGPVVSELALVFAEDWAFETGKEVPPPSPEAIAAQNSPATGVAMSAQVVPTGPTEPGLNFRRLALATIQCAQRELILTTPYFVPDESMLMSLLMAADRGVDVKLIVPQKLDALLPAAASRSHYQRLLEGGVSIYQYQPGLLHAKTMTVDDAFALFGSANLDVRSFELNFELSLLLYGKEVTERLRGMQRDFLASSRQLQAKEWGERPIVRQYADRAVALLSPLL